jgi:peptidoglycan/xylan/chitin deacetylase (PgdA/CDA1 family)
MPLNGRRLSRRDLLLLGGTAAALSACDPGSGTVPTASPASHPRTSSSPSSPAVSPTGTGTAPPAAAGDFLEGTVYNSGGDVVHGPRTNGAIALTFHGAGSSSIADQILRELASGGAHVTIFAVGTWLAAAPQFARVILDAGHDLGNHTYHHLAMSTLGSGQADTEVARCAELLTRLTGSAGRWFRPSGTPTSNQVIRAAARQSGYRRCISYDVDSLDYTDPGASAVVANVLSHAQAGSIVSLHLGHLGTVTALPAILDGLAARNLRPVTLSALLS